MSEKNELESRIKELEEKLERADEEIWDLQQNFDQLMDDLNSFPPLEDHFQEIKRIRSGGKY